MGGAAARVRVRPMTVADARRVADLTTQLGYPTEPAETERRFRHIADRPDDAVLVATDGERVIGWIHVELRSSLEVSDQANIGGLVVDDAHRSAGVGVELVAAGERWARSRGATTIIVRSRSTRERAHRFYQRIGFVEIKRSHIFEKPLV